MKHLKIAMWTATLAALILGMALITQDHTPHFFVLYYTKALPISLTAGALAYFISLACKDIKKRGSTLDKKNS